MSQTTKLSKVHPNFDALKSEMANKCPNANLDNAYLISKTNYSYTISYIANCQDPNGTMYTISVDVDTDNN